METEPKTYDDGVTDTRKKVLDWLEAKYMEADVARGDPKADAILELTRELSRLMR